MGKATLIRGARQLLTLRGPRGARRGPDLRNLGIIQDGAVLISDGLIREVGPSRRVENLAVSRGADEIDASGRVVMPGFVDSHVHLGSSGARVSDQEMRAIDDAVRHGTTAIEAKSGPGMTDGAELKMLRGLQPLAEQRIPVISTLFAADDGSGKDDHSARYIERVCTSVLPAVRRRELAEFAEILCNSGSFSPAQICRFLTTARDLGLGLRLNAGMEANSRAIGAAVEIGAWSVGHVGEVDERETMLLARAPTVATFMPAALFQCGFERCLSARTLIDRGAAVALATGYHLFECPAQSMQMTIALASRMLQMTAAEAIAASTVNAAHVIGRAASIGSIECGKSADLLMLSVPDFRELPYHFGVNLVELVMSRGRVLVERSEVKWPVVR
jgi:imidazolonepropionase